MKVVLRLVIAIAVALVLLGLGQWFLSGSLVDGFVEGARILFLFMDIGLGVWLVLLIVGAVRGWGRGPVLLSAVVGVVLNLLTVIVVGFVQGGAAPWAFMLWAVEGGAAFLVGAVVAAPAVQPRPRPASRSQPRSGPPPRRRASAAQGLRGGRCGRGSSPARRGTPPPRPRPGGRPCRSGGAACTPIACGSALAIVPWLNEPSRRRRPFIVR